MRREFGCGMREGRVLERSRASHLSPLTRHSPSAPQSAFLFCIPHRVESPHSLLLPDPAFLFCILHPGASGRSSPLTSSPGSRIPLLHSASGRNSGSRIPLLHPAFGRISPLPTHFFAAAGTP